MDVKTTRKEREKNRHHDEIIDAAEVLFAEKGFHGTTMEDVASRSEFAVGTLYNFFPSKKLLYQNLIEQRCRQLRDEVYKMLIKADNPIAIIKTYIQAKIQLCQKYHAFVKLYTRERLGDRFTDSDLWWKTVAPIYEDVMDRLTGAFQVGINDGYFRADLDPADMTIALEGLTDGFMHQWLMFPDKYVLNDHLESMIRQFFNGIFQESPKTE